MLNSTLRKAADDVIKTNDPGQFSLTAHFLSSASGSTFSFYPLIISGMTINQDFANNYADEIDLHMKVSPHDYALMQDQGQDLLCVLTVTYMDQNGKLLTTPSPIQRQYHVMINNPRDVRKAMPDIQLNKDPVTDMTVRLIEPSVYALRQTKLNAVFQTATVKQVIHALTQELGISKLHLVEPDNTHQHDHIVVGSYQGISSVFSYLQSTCGVYQKGINGYVTKNCLYVFPAFETDPKHDKTLIFYQTETGRYTGSPAFHKLGTDKVEVVINSQPQSVDLSISGSENVGTGFIFNRASRLLDGLTTIIDKDGPKFTQNPALTIALKTARTAMGGVNNLVHVHGTDNPFPKMSELAAHQASLMRIPWMNADPFVLDPCYKVLFYYDENKVMVSKTGAVEQAVYHIKPIKKVDSRYMFGCVGDLALRLSPNATKNFTDSE